MVLDVTNSINKLKYFDWLLVSLIFALNIPFIISTWDNVWYSDDYQLILGFGFKQALSGDLYLTIQDLFEVRSDGHLTTVHYFFNYIASLINSYTIWHLIVVIFHVVASFLVYKVAQAMGFTRVVAALSSLLYTINYSIHIKILTWNCWHSFVFNMVSGLLMLIFATRFINNKEKKNLFGVLVFGLLTVFNMESGLVFLVLAIVFGILKHKQKLLSTKNLVGLSLVSILPLILYSSIAMYQTSSPLPLLKARMGGEQVLQENKAESIAYLRSRVAPRTTSVYLIRGAELMLASINLSSIEYSLKYFMHRQYLDYNTIKKSIYDNVLFIVVLLVLFIALISFYVLRNYKLILKNSMIRDMFLLYLVTLVAFIFIFNRKDIANILAFPASIIFSYIVCQLYHAQKKKLSIALLMMFVLPTIAYTTTGYEYVYEMYSKTDRKNIYREFNMEKDNYQFNDGMLKINDGLNEKEIIKKFRMDFFWHYVWLNRDKMLHDEKFNKYSNMTYDQFMMATRQLIH